MDNMTIYNACASVPGEACRTIQAGRLKGMTDINPMWRIKMLTEMFGPCGIGWATEIKSKHIEDGAGGERVAIVDIDLYIKAEGEWSRPIPGTGGSMLVTAEKSGLHTSDEAFKMAYTDALSVCCKMLGIGADVYWAAGSTKYSRQEPEARQEPDDARQAPTFYCTCCNQKILPAKVGNVTYTAQQIAESSAKKFGAVLCWTCSKNANKA